MSHYLYMNERIRQKKPVKPVIVHQGRTRTTEANRFALQVGDRIIGYVTYDARGLDDCDTHNVKAWVELDDDVHVFAVPQRGIAVEKKPNEKVKL